MKSMETLEMPSNLSPYFTYACKLVYVKEYINPRINACKKWLYIISRDDVDHCQFATGPLNMGVNLAQTPN